MTLKTAPARAVPQDGRLKAANGEVVASGESYKTKQGAKDGCEAVQRAAAGAQVEDV